MSILREETLLWFLLGVPASKLWLVSPIMCYMLITSPSTEESVRGLKETLGIPPKIVFLMPSSSDGSWFAEQGILPSTSRFWTNVTYGLLFPIFCQLLLEMPDGYLQTLCWWYPNCSGSPSVCWLALLNYVSTTSRGQLTRFLIKEACTLSLG